jgi:hypothetical protein
MSGSIKQEQPEMPGRFADAVSIEIARAEAHARALVPLCEDKPPGPFDHFAGLRANFLAHLIATRDRLPQTTVLRRDTPETALGAYAPHRLERSAGIKSRLV